LDEKFNFSLNSYIIIFSSMHYRN